MTLASAPEAQAVADIVRTTLGPRAMLKMLLDASGGIILTNDGNAILREIDVSHPAAKSIIELSRTQDEEVGDGTTSVIILGEFLGGAAAAAAARRHQVPPPPCARGQPGHAQPTAHTLHTARLTRRLVPSP